MAISLQLSFPEHRPPHPHPPSTTVAHIPVSAITTCGPFLLPFSPPDDHHQARGSIKWFDSNPSGFWDPEKMNFSFSTTEAHILGLSLDCKERSRQLRRRSLDCPFDDGAMTIVSIILNISQYYRYYR
ncbi:hypothetical protein ACFX2I_031005 [Malus domestica]